MGTEHNKDLGNDSMVDNLREKADHVADEAREKVDSVTDKFDGDDRNDADRSTDEGSILDGDVIESSTTADDLTYTDEGADAEVRSDTREGSSY